MKSGFMMSRLTREFDGPLYRIDAIFHECTRLINRINSFQWFFDVQQKFHESLLWLWCVIVIWQRTWGDKSIDKFLQFALIFWRFTRSIIRDTETSYKNTLTTVCLQHRKKTLTYLNKHQPCWNIARSLRYKFFLDAVQTTHQDRF